MADNLPSELELELLVQSSQAGDTEAFAKLYDHFLNPIYKYIFFRVPNFEAEDLTETVFLKAWQSISRYRRGAVPFSAWLFRIAKNTVIDFYRTNRETVELEDQIEDPKLFSNPKRLAEQELLRLQVKKALKHLPEPQRDLVILKFLDNRDNREIAAILNKTEGAIRVLQLRALKNLKKILENL